MAGLVGFRLYYCYNCLNSVALHDDNSSKAFQGIPVFTCHECRRWPKGRLAPHDWSPQLQMYIARIVVRCLVGSMNEHMKNHRSTNKVNSYSKSRKSSRIIGS